MREEGENPYDRARRRPDPESNIRTIDQLQNVAKSRKAER